MDPDPFGEISEDEVAAVRGVKEALDNNNLIEAVDLIKHNLEELNNVQLNIAITGESGSGKSTFVNAFRGLGDENEGSAATGVVETTIEAKAYPHPKFPNVQIWDLPGIGTQSYKPEEYLKKVKFERYDFFIIISSDRFRLNDIMLATTIQEMNKKFYFLRSKIDVSLDAEKRKKNFSEEVTLDSIRQNCIKALCDGGVASPLVFLVSSFQLGLYDFPTMEKTMEEQLPEYKRHALLLAIPNISLEINQKKKETLKGNVWKMALVSATVAAIPVPGLSIAVDVAILLAEITKYSKVFGLDKDSLQNLADKTHMTVEGLSDVIQYPVSKAISTGVVLKMLMKASGGLVMALEYWLSNIPVLGSVAAGGLSCVTTYRMLSRCIDEMAEDSNDVLMKALHTP